MLEEHDRWVNCHGGLAERFASKEARLQSFVPEGENINYRTTCISHTNINTHKSGHAYMQLALNGVDRVTNDRVAK